MRSTLDTGAVVTVEIVPPGSTAVTANVTVGSGSLTINPGGSLIIGAATANWTRNGQILNNGGTLTLNAPREVTVVAGGIGSSSTQFVIDITGYSS